MLFDLDELNVVSHEPDDKSGMKAEQFLAMHGERIDAVKNLSGRFPLPGEIFFLWTINSFNAFTFIPYIISEIGTIDELIITTYSVNTRMMDALVRLIDAGDIKDYKLLISDSIKTRLPKVYDHLTTLINNKKVNVIFSWNHSKITLIRSGDHHFIIEGSGNCSENALHEQYVFLDSKKIYEFRKNQILHGIECRPD
jgi:hypothetical protein